MKQTSHNPADYIVPLTIDGLSGRMLHMPSRNEHKREILFVYGHHSTLERWWGLVEVLNRYGSVTMPDLPGFGGMGSFYKVGQQPTVDNLADYLAAFIKWRYKRKRVTIAGMSFGFVVVTRMLQKYPELAAKVDLLVSIVGFAHHDDFTFSKNRYWFYRSASTILSYKIPATLFRYVALNRYVLRAVYARTHNAKKKFAAAVSKDDFGRLMDVEVELWQKNDVQTHMHTSVAFLTLDNTTKQVNLPVWHVSTQHDHYFDNTVVEQHMRCIYTDFYEVETKMTSHAPSVIADAKMAEPLLPVKLRKVLAGS
ncbi:MAG TPA: alpha/beta hydrolase [Candidatus Limnocylindrales bacterium]|nr:alpha/beta hydrolase [Candidatus Limnocylindrales bacterium]